MKRFFLTIILLFFITIGCRKKNIKEDCSELLEAMQTDNVTVAGKSITSLINNLSSQTYNEQNLQNLAASITGNCSCIATVLCFDCIFTLPSQTEIQIKYFNSSSSLQKTIDISYSADTSMRFVNMHD